MIEPPSLDFIAAGGNEHPAIADVDPRTGFVAFGVGQNVATWQPAPSDASHGPSGIKALLPGHLGLVTTVKCWRLQDRTLLVSGSADTTVRLWNPVLKHISANGFRCSSVLQSHTKSVNASACLDDSDLLITAGADGEVKVWRVKTDDNATTIDVSHDLQVQMLQSFSTKPAFVPMTVALARIPGSEGLVLAVAGTKPVIQIFVADDIADPVLNHAATLSGHEGWIRALDFTNDSSSNDEAGLLLASACQDRYIRLWRLQMGNRASPESKDPAASKFDPVATMIGGAMSNKAHRFQLQTKQTPEVASSQSRTYAITFEALLVGHEDWIFSAKWLPKCSKLKLLTASADNSLSIWEPEEASGVWTCTVRLGEISAQKGATTATGSAGGFWTGLWLNGGKAVMCLGKTGGWRLWTHDEVKDRWEQDVAVTGHTQPVGALAWAPDGSYLLSTGADKTTRLWAPTKDGTWHEFSRPQIHGYDLSCIDTITNSRFISGADEKLLRVFDQPKAVADWLSRACGIESSPDSAVVEAANMPVLGLSNKAIDAEDAEDQRPTNSNNTDPPTDDSASRNPSTQPTTAAPTEDTLSRSLLWPEIEKLYGHSYEISACAVSTSGALVTTACKASSVTHAAIRIYRTSDWRLAQPPLEAHSLTVARLRWSEDDRFFVSVSRDRTCAVFQRRDDGGGKVPGYAPVEGCPVKVHSRMVLDVAWLPIHEGRYCFATAGRDKVVSVWRLRDDNNASSAGGEPGKPTSPLEQMWMQTMASPVTAVDCIASNPQHHALLAYGLEDGSITALELRLGDHIEVTSTMTLPPELSPSKAITQLGWRPTNPDREGGKRILAVASEDASVRLYSFDYCAKEERTNGAI